MSPILNAIAALSLAAGAGAASVSARRGDAPDLAVPGAPWSRGHKRDGRAFHTTDTLTPDATWTTRRRYWAQQLRSAGARSGALADGTG